MSQGAGNMRFSFDRPYRHDDDFVIIDDFHFYWELSGNERGRADDDDAFPLGSRQLRWPVGAPRMR